MNNTITMQLYSLLIFLLCGLIIGLYFDIFRILRKSFKTPDIITYLEDIIFWLFTGGFLLFITFTFQNGQIRCYNIIGIFLGITLYFFTLSKFFIKINVSIINIFKVIIGNILKIILYPLKIFIKPFSFIVINFRKNFTYFKINIKNIKTKKQNKNQKTTKKSFTDRRIFKKNVEKYNKEV